MAIPAGKFPNRKAGSQTGPFPHVAWRYSLRTRAILYFGVMAALLVLLCLLVITQGIPFTSYQGLYARNKEAAFEKLNLLADIGQQRVTRWIGTKRAEAQDIATDPRLLDNLPKLTALTGSRQKLIPAPESYQIIKSFCADRLAGHPDYESIDLLSPSDGRVLFSTRPDREGIFYPRLACGATVNAACDYCQFPVEPEPSASGPIISYCSLVLAPDGRRLGILVLRLNTATAFASLFSRFNLPHRSLEAVLVNHEGIPLLPLPRDFSGQKSITSQAITLALKGETGNSSVKDYQGVPTLAAYRPIKVGGEKSTWGLVIQQSRAEVFAVYRKETRAALAFAGLGLGIWIVLITLLSGRLTQPLLKLSRAAQAADKGDLSAQAEVSSSDEIGQLALTFNQMLAHIRQWHQELEAAVIARTLALKELNEDLQNEVIRRQTSETALQQASDYHRSLIEASLDPMVTIGPDGKITDVNAATEAATGYRREQLIGTDFCDYFTEPERAHSGYQQVFREGSVRDYPLELRHREGGVISVLYNAAVYRDDRGEVIGVFAAARDITERKQAEAALQGQSRFLQTIIDALPTPVFYKDIKGRYLGCNKAFEAVLGKSRQEIIGRTVFDLIPSEGAELNAQMDERLLQEGGNQTYEFYLIDANGAHREAIFSKAVFYNTDGSLAGIIGTILDITERKRIEAALRESEQRYRMLAENIIDVIWTTDLDMRLTYISPSVKRQRGYGPEELLGKPPEDTMTPASAVTVRNALRELLANACDSAEESFSPVRYEVEAFRKDGATFFAEVEITLMLDALGQACGILGVTRDITARKHAELAVRESEHQFREVLENVSLIAITSDLQGKVIFCNDYLLNLTGRRREAVLGQDWFDIFIPSNIREPLRAAFKQPERGIPCHYENEIITAEGELRMVHWSNTPLRTPAGDIVGLTSIGEDITERKRAESEIWRLNQELELRVKQRTAELEAANKDLESFAYSISHDLRAPLRSIDGFSLSLLEEYQDKLDEQARGDFKRIRNAAQYMGRLIEGLLNLSQVSRTRLQATPVNLSKLSREIIRELQSAEPERKARVCIAKGLEVLGDPNLLRVGLHNLLSNSWKFTGRQRRAEIEFGVQGENGKPVYFVRDNGVGFDMAYVHKLFGVFQRLHSPGEFPGTGIGLVTVQKIIQRHGGEIWAEGAPGQGATFFFTLGKEADNVHGFGSS